MRAEFELQTGRREDFILITGKINDILAQNGLTEGCCTIFIPHTTAALTINEFADPDVAGDLLAFLNQLAPLKGSYRHREGNSDAHIKAALLGSSLHLIVQNGLLDLGKWQGVFLAEFDGPRRRKIRVWLEGLR